MRLWIISDLHMPRKRHLDIYMPEADACVIAGDLGEGIDTQIVWLAHTITLRMPVVYVLGNHEYYGEELPVAITRARAYAKRVSGLHLLENGVVVIDGVRFLGATLWTDYRLQAHGERAGQVDAMRTAKARISDHTNIWMEPVGTGFVARHFEPRDALAMHEASVAWLDAALAEPHAGPTVVVSHHAPHPLSVAPRYASDATTPAFVSDLSSLIDRRQPDLWVHGHTHASFDYTLEPLDGRATRVVCNPRGYTESENPDFVWDLVVEI